MNSAAFISWNIGGEVPAIHTRLQAGPSEGHATETTGERGPQEAGKFSGTCTIYSISTHSCCMLKKPQDKFKQRCNQSWARQQVLIKNLSSVLKGMVKDKLVLAIVAGQIVSDVPGLISLIQIRDIKLDDRPSLNKLFHLYPFLSQCLSEAFPLPLSGLE